MSDILYWSNVFITVNINYWSQHVQTSYIHIYKMLCMIICEENENMITLYEKMKQLFLNSQNEFTHTCI